MINFNLKDSRNSVTFHVVIFAVVTAIIYFFRLLGDNMPVFGSIVTTVAGLLSVATGIYALRRLGLDSLHGKSVLVLVIANFLWVVADLTWLTVNKLALVSFSDILWLAAYPLFFFGILFGIQAFVGNIFKSKIRLVVAGILTVVLGGLYLYFFPLSWNPEMTDVENMVSIGYVLGDLFLILPLILLVCISFGERFSLSWVLIGLSLIFTLVDDMSYVFNPDGYFAGSLVDLVRFAAYILYAISFIYMRNSVEIVPAPVQKMPDAPVEQKQPLPLAEENIVQKKKIKKNKKPKKRK